MKGLFQRNELTEREHKLSQQIEEIRSAGLQKQEDDLLQRVCLRLAEGTPVADNAFQQRLEGHLLVRLGQRREAGAVQGRVSRNLLLGHFSAKCVRMGLAVTSVLILSLAATWPAVGQILSKHIAPRQIAAWPSPPHVAVEPSATPRTLDAAQQEKAVGFPLLMPTYLPAGCTLQNRINISRIAHLVYSCVIVDEQATDRVWQPPVGMDSTQEVTVNGQPAIYIDGVWITDKPGGDAVWKSGVAGQLTFERNNLIVHLISVRQSSSSPQLSKEDLIRIGESIR